ncbi:MAG: hypothetical protein HQL34_14190 [Alphaproteobacteria bacterium]|nr:hypothetical protein [Alphaproteobacteria bacterium]
MDITSYLLVLTASLGLTGVGGGLLPGAPLGRRFLAGMALVSGICGSLAWVAPVAVVPLCRLSIVMGLIAGLIELRRGVTKVAFDKKALVSVGLAAVIGLGVALPFHFRFVEVGDNNYFLGQVVELNGTASP